MKLLTHKPDSQAAFISSPNHGAAWAEWVKTQGFEVRGLCDAIGHVIYYRPLLVHQQQDIGEIKDLEVPKRSTNPYYEKWRQRCQSRPLKP